MGIVVLLFRINIDDYKNNFIRKTYTLLLLEFLVQFIIISVFVQSHCLVNTFMNINGYFGFYYVFVSYVISILSSIHKFQINN